MGIDRKISPPNNQTVNAFFFIKTRNDIYNHLLLAHKWKFRDIFIIPRFVNLGAWVKGPVGNTPNSVIFTE